MTTEVEKEPEWYRLEDLDPEDIDDEFGDMIIEQRLQVNNEDALERIADDLKLPEDLPWIETLTVVSKECINVPDVFDDLKREEAFYNQALEAVHIAREKIMEADATFSVPENFIAPMLKDDQHMEEVYQKLVEEAKDGNEEALYRLHAFEKQRKKASRVDEKQKMLSRKRKEGKEDTELKEDDFELEMEGLEDSTERTGKNKSNVPRKQYTRDARDAKYSLGKRGREGKQEDRANPAKKGMSIRKKSSLKRPGKAKRQKMRNQQK
ncbi:hypothetical protein G6F46_005633 [Rhizopus delemar]|uniref:Uncharacterized protein n=2 Tax=Rhizopus TaxID=4842 RepID=A0A9P6Z5K0_9FUNG|nr:hypothetical protein G6F43_011055 [Rhizopus delemar]KAG1547442.1 hypothetical protein G6F51_004260 [Rhizopus arrhizus]KAG1460177.1 hypothetical protein G6F55_004317 [Rhizopus delemar]KAG1502503.1 hypothetical protein G6F54_002314 [Rhizopus delemar]KAG1511285.1 hypothetical protein G6F53_006056 [Rhizopus delemar]